MANSRISLPIFLDLAASETGKYIEIQLKGHGVLETLKFWATDNNVLLYQKAEEKGLRLLGQTGTIKNDLTTAPVEKLYSGGELIVLPFNKPYVNTKLRFYIDNETAAAKEAIIIITIMEKKSKYEARPEYTTVKEPVAVRF